MLTKMKSSLQLILLPSVLFLCIPAYFIKLNIRDVENLDATVTAILLAMALILTVVLIAVIGLFKWLRSNFFVRLITEFLFFFVVITGFLFPVSISTGMLDASQYPIDLLNLAIAAGLAALMCWISNGKHRNTLYIGLMIFIGLNTAISGFELYTKFAKSKERAVSLHQVSSGKNIFVLSLDGIPGSAAKMVLDADASLRNKFDGFTMFNKVASSSPATSASIATSLYGNRNYKSTSATEKELWDSNPDGLLTNYLDANGYTVSTYGVYNFSFHDADRTHESTYVLPISLTELINFTIARTITSTFTLPGNSLDGLESWVRNNVFNAEQEHQLLLQIENSRAPDWKKDESPTVLDLNEYIEELHVGSSQPVAHFSHFTFSHFPVEFDRNCQFMGWDARWFALHQNRYGVLEETRCTLSKFALFLDKLKTLDIYENSLVVLKSDHGKPVSFNDPRSIESAKIMGHSLWGIGRYAPFLAIKGFGPADTRLAEDTSPVLLDDLALTVCLSVLNDNQCTSYPGFDLLEENLVIPDDAEATFFIVQSPFSDFKFETHRAVTVKRHPDILENLYKKTRY